MLKTSMLWKSTELLNVSVEVDGKRQWARSKVPYFRCFLWFIKGELAKGCRWGNMY